MISLYLLQFGFAWSITFTKIPDLIDLKYVEFDLTIPQSHYSYIFTNSMFKAHCIY